MVYELRAEEYTFMHGVTVIVYNEIQRQYYQFILKGILKRSLRRIGNPPCGAGLPVDAFYSLLQSYVIEKLGKWLIQVNCLILIKLYE